MEKEIGLMGEKEPTEGGGVLKDKARGRFFGRRTGSEGLMGKLKSLVIFVFIFVLGFMVMQFMVAEKYDVSVMVIGAESEIDSDATAEGLDFGSLPRGDSSTRFITIRNGGENDAYVKIYKWGEASRFLETNRDGFTLEAGENENLEFTIKVPSEAQEKEYEGRLVIFEIPRIF